MTYATLDDITVKWRPLSTTDAARASALLQEAEALLNMQVKSLPTNVAAGTVSTVLARKVVTDAVIRVLANPAGVASQTLGPETVAFTGVRTLGTIAFTKDELASVLPDATQPGTVLIGGAAVGSTRMRLPLTVRRELMPQWLGERGALGALEDMAPDLAAEEIAAFEAGMVGLSVVDPALLDQALAPLDLDGNA